MKKVKFIAACLLLAFVSSCNQDETLLQSNGGNDDTTLSNNGTLTEKITSQFIESKVAEFAKPNSTVLNFQVYDPNGFRILAVKFYDRATDIVTYVTMTRSGKYWKLDKKMEGNGWYDWRYVYKDTKTNISNTAYVLCSTYNTFNSNGVSSIRWPFGADGSNWKNRTVYVNKKYQKWLGGSKEEGGAGNGPGEGKHNGDREKYADDWNRGTSPNDDLGAELRSPFDGEVLNFGTYETDYGSSKFVSVIQQGPDGTVYKFFFGHLQSYPSYLIKKTSKQRGTPVKAGITLIGWLGKSGASLPHAHCSMRKNSNEESVKFSFDAQ